MEKIYTGSTLSRVNVLEMIIEGSLSFLTFFTALEKIKNNLLLLLRV
jgi:hypothetical protein